MKNKALIFPQKEIDVQNYYWFNQGFNDAELKAIYEGVANLPYIDAGTGDTNTQDKKVRSSKIKWIPQEDQWEWVYAKLMEMIVEANKSLWNFDLHSVLDNVQYTEYHANEEGHYNWHQDLGPGWLSRRKISVTVQLSDPSEYEGGELEYWKGGPIEYADKAPKGKGVVFIFPSYMMHRVSPVTKGVRRSFVLWVGGIPFK
jgi:PKHD-type hydroxylase